MFGELWRLLVNFLRDFTREISRILRVHWKGIGVFCAVAFIGLIVVMALVLKATASYKFCASCHNMQSYIESWQQSSHSEVSCLECHFEPGVVGELKGKWKAQTHVVMKITGTAPSRPHTQISDASCLREGCHSITDLSETEVVFKGVKFNHKPHLGELRRGKKMRCVGCHSQIVQGEHLTVTETTCFTCHFYDRANSPQTAECQVCHVQTKAKIFIGANENLPFVHKDYLDRGVLCEQCHFDVVFGDGHLKDNICTQCHAEPEIIKSQYSGDEMHQHHVTEHKVECFRCHAVIDHGIIRPGDKAEVVSRHQAETDVQQALVGFHYDANCVKCHTFDQHETIRMMYMGSGAADVPEMPSPMYLAHADCGTCHIALTTGAGGEKRGTPRFDTDEVVKSCSDCHGEGYDDMAKHWKKLLTEELEKTDAALLAARKALAGNRTGEKAAEATKVLDVAERNLRFTRNGRGLHNIDYALRVLADSQARAERVKETLVAGYKMKQISPPTGCTQLCHSCVECIETTPVPFGNVQFPHDIHVQDEGMGCEECHSPRERHGHTILGNCNDCHHGSGAGAVECQDCHVENHNLYLGQNACDEESCDVRGEPNPMAEAVECQECHVQVVEKGDSSLASIKATCVECHDDDPAYGAMVDDWKQEVAALDAEGLDAMLKETQRMILSAIRNGVYTYDAQDLVNNAEKNLKLITTGNAIHNLAFSKDLAKRVRTLLTKARKDLQTYTTVRTLKEKEYL